MYWHLFVYEHILYTRLLIEYAVGNTETLRDNRSALSWRLPEINILIISDARAYLDVAQKWHSFASAVKTNIPKRRHKTSGTLDTDHQSIYHHMITKIKTGHSWFVGDSNLPPRSLGGPTAARPPGQEKEKSRPIYRTTHAWVSYSGSGWMGTPTLTSGAILLLLATFLLIF